MTIFYTFYQSFPLPTNSSWFFENFQFFISCGKIFLQIFQNFDTFQTFSKICNLSHFLPNFSTLHKFQLIFPKFSMFHFKRGKNIFQICLNLSIFQTFNKNWQFFTLFTKFFHFPQISADFSRILNFSFHTVKYSSWFFKNFQFFILRVEKIFFQICLNLSIFQTFNKIYNLSHFLPNFSTLHKFQLIFPKFSIFHFMRGKNIFQICLNLCNFSNF